MTHNAVTQEETRLPLSVPLTGGILTFPVHSRPQPFQAQGLLHYSSLSWGAAIGPLFYEWAGYAHHLLFAVRALPFEPLWVGAPSCGFL